MDTSSSKVSSRCGITSTQFSLVVLLTGVFINLKLVALSLLVCIEKYGEKKDVCNAIGAHHDEIEMKTLFAPIVQVCDAISRSSPY